jgi:hypothetical protein
MSSIILLTNNSENIDIIANFIDYLSPLQNLTFSYKSTRLLDLYTDNNEEMCKGDLKLHNFKIDVYSEFNKTENCNYSSAIITDHTFINNLMLFYDEFKIDMLETTININGITYNSNSYISINNINYYILNQI